MRSILSILLFAVNCAFAHVPEDPIQDDVVYYETNGFRLRISVPPDAGPEKPEIHWEIENAVKFERVAHHLRTDSGGLWLELADAKGEKINPLEGWRRRNDPMRPNFSFIGHRFKPGERISATLDLRTAFGDDWKRGRKLSVRWRFWTYDENGLEIPMDEVWGTTDISGLYSPKSTGPSSKPHKDSPRSTPVRPGDRASLDDNAAKSQTDRFWFRPWIYYAVGVALLAGAVLYWLKTRGNQQQL